MRKNLPKLILLTNVANGEAEDQWLSNELSGSFSVKMCHPLECEAHEKKADMVLIRNIWPLTNWRAQMAKAYLRWFLAGISVFNPPTGKGDFRGKQYLCDLWQGGYPVIPSITDERNLHRLPRKKDYFSKPLFVGSSSGCFKVNQTEIVPAMFANRVVQPFLALNAEMSFIYVNNRHVFTIQNRPESRWDVCLYDPSPEELRVARSFVEWNALPIGIQRIDLCRTEEGELLLMEIEDFCPYLSLLEIDSFTREAFVQQLSKALLRHMRRHSISHLSS